MHRQKEDFSAEVAEHYNQVPQKSVGERKKSDIIALRRFNNGMKSLLLNDAITYLVHPVVEPPLRVLDLGCGKGGDLQKYNSYRNISLVVGLDIAEVSIKQCQQRFDSMRSRFKGQFYVADLTRIDLWDFLSKKGVEEKFHLASAQFNIHYSFESYDQAVRYIRNAADSIVRLGFFVGTYPDGPKLIKLARESKTPGVHTVNEKLTIKFSPEDMKNPKPFGTKYHFKLKEVVDCPEFLVHPKILNKLLTTMGFHCVYDKSFEESLRDALEHTPDKVSKAKSIFQVHAALDFSEMNVAKLDEDTWKVASLYRCFCYRKAS